MTTITADAMEKTEEFLEQYGVKGMKWGVRRTDAQLERSKGKKEDGGGDSSSSAKKVSGKTVTSGKKASDMSDAELKKVVERINTERNYAKLTAPPPAKSAAIKKFVADIAVNVARQQVTAVANQQASKVIGDLMASKVPKSPVPAPPNRFPSAPPNPLDRVG